MFDLQAVFSNEPPDRTATLSAPAPSPGTATPGPGRPETPDVQSVAEIPVHPLDVWLAAEDFSKWTYQGGRYIGPDADPADDFDSLPGPGQPCPVCGSHDLLWGLWGDTCCQRCNPDRLARSFKLAERARRLRSKNHV